MKNLNEVEPFQSKDEVLELMEHLFSETCRKQFFEWDYEGKVRDDGKIEQMIMAIRLPSGAIETIINTQNIDSKYEYYINAYNDSLELKTNPEVRIIDWMIV